MRWRGGGRAGQTPWGWGGVANPPHTESLSLLSSGEANAAH